MALTHEQLMLFMSGVSFEASSMKEGWEDMYGKEDPQSSIDRLTSIIDNVFDVVSTHVYEQKEHNQRMMNIIRGYEDRVISKPLI